MSLKDFQIICKLGEGAYSTVYKVLRESDQQLYALKKVKLGNLSQKEIENALNEVRILASIKNENIVGYKQVFLEGKNLCIVMEFLDDGDLYQKICEKKKKSLTYEEKEIWSVVIQTLYGLKSLHSLSILHRDLKSANVFLSKDGSAKLGDLNVSKLAKNGLLYTQTGTPYYASPEVWRDEPYDMKSDIWSLGCVIYEMATLQPPFMAEDMEGLYQKINSGIYHPISSSYSKELSHLIKVMLQLKSKIRPSVEKILKSSMIQKKIEELSLNIQTNDAPKDELLRTIRVPKNLHYLTEKLPKPAYETDIIENFSLSNSPSIERKPRNTIDSKSTNKHSLPKLRQVLKGTNSPNNIDRKKSKLKEEFVVEGKSKLMEEPQDRYSLNIGKEIQEEIKKVYKAKKHACREQGIKESQKSMVLPSLRI